MNLSLKWCRTHNVAVLNEHAPYKIALADDCDELLLEKLRIELNKEVVPVKTDLAKIKKLLISKTIEAESFLHEDCVEQKNTWESEPIINLVDSIIEGALERSSTDIHLEPGNGVFRIRLRQDGLLNDYKTLPLWTQEPVLVRLKILASIDITDKRIPHDGSFLYNGFRQNANIRVSTLPVQNGEKCVLRLLPLNATETQNEIGLSALQLSQKSLNYLRKIFNSPQGIFLVTGPTGSGKTTTLHAGLQEILRKHINVTTIEDPIEYPLEKANQVQVNEKCGLTFANALRAILRQDPDVILVGEIRDSETAQIALRAAQTGHLVLSTLHTNSAKAAYARLYDLGVSKQMLQESLLAIMAQRLVRTIDSNGEYKGRIAVVEILKPEGTFVDGSLEDNAKKLVCDGITDAKEIERVINVIDCKKESSDIAAAGLRVRRRTKSSYI